MYANKTRYWIQVYWFGIHRVMTDKNLEKDYQDKLYSDKLIKDSVEALNGSKDIGCGWDVYAGDIPHDWERRLDTKIAELEDKVNDT